MTGCPDELELTKAISTSDPEVVAHVEECTSCRTQWDMTMRALKVVRQRPVAMPSNEHFEELRTALLASQPEPKVRPLDQDTPQSEPVSTTPGRSRRIVWLPLSAVAAAAVFAFVVFSRPETPSAPTRHYHGSIAPHANASYSLATTTPDEIVMLYEGAIDVDVAPLHAGERFRVLVGDAEIEVHGTSFVVTARAGHLIGVIVRHGIVDVRPTGAASRRLAAGESWAPPDVASAPVTSPVPPTVAPIATLTPSVGPVATRSAIKSSTPAPRSDARNPEPAKPAADQLPPARKPRELAYDDGWVAMRANDFSRAAASFARVLILDGDGPLTEDASYWLAVALARGKQSDRAATAFRDFITSFPGSHRVGEANAMLGWILVDSNQPDEAARRFRAALNDQSPAIRDSAKAGLDAVTRRR